MHHFTIEMESGAIQCISRQKYGSVYPINGAIDIDISNGNIGHLLCGIIPPQANNNKHHQHIIIIDFYRITQQSIVAYFFPGKY